MEISSSNIKKIFSKESCSYISGNENPEIFLIFSQEQHFLYFRKQKPRRKTYISGNVTFLYFGKGSPEKNSYISGNRISVLEEVKKPTLKKLIFGK